MSRIKVMVNGIPGNMAAILARHILADARFELLPYSLTGPEIQVAEHKVSAISIRLLKPAERKKLIEEIAPKKQPFLSAD